MPHFKRLFFLIGWNVYTDIVHADQIILPHPFICYTLDSHELVSDWDVKSRNISMIL